MSSQLSRIALGTVQFGLDYGINNSSGKVVEEDVYKILKFAHQSQIKVLDTAAAYGNSETLIGNFLKKNNEYEFRIITKFNLKDKISPLESLNKSLTKLNLDAVDTIMFHSFDDFMSTNQKDLIALLEVKGFKFDKLGVSLYTNDEILEVSQAGVFDVIQVPFNVLDNENQRGKCLKALKEKGLEIHTRSIFLQGLFFMEINRIPNVLSPLIQYLEELRYIASRHHISVSQLALSYVLSKSYIDKVIVGVDNLEQLKVNIQDAQIKVSNEAFKEIDNIIVKETSLLNPSTWNR